MKKNRKRIREIGERDADTSVSYYEGLLDDLHDHHVTAHRHMDLDNLFLGFRDRSGNFSEERQKPPTPI